ncbi:DUF3638 domain-containing protein [Criblamydia sequanensis]|uniref:ubiquitinyl hydrolase 1 n=1 Tax=Candidatus Criblamydia sequanensis CRIB-18 TaxID=1437425 RepID=A0A090CYG2_9BACT|nr:DUF3638 domain-containing protein [Criblamydia sequanensis]CDR33416.1 Conserved hypothetical protein [Criblamydia sequanensis CRIB-18]
MTLSSVYNLNLSRNSEIKLSDENKDPISPHSDLIPIVDKILRNTKGLNHLQTIEIKKKSDGSSAISLVCAKGIKKFQPGETLLSQIKELFETTHFGKESLIIRFQKENTPLCQRNYDSLSDNLFAHIHADEFGLGSQLQGLNFEATLRYVLKFIKTTKRETYFSEKFLNLLREALDFDTTNEEAFVNQFNFKYWEVSTGKNPYFILPGGWCGKPGHAIYYKIYKDKIEIFNLGGGVENHLNESESAIPILQIKGILASKFRDDELPKILFQVKNNLVLKNASYKNTDYGEKDIYQNLVDFLEPQELVIPEETRPMHIQKSGFCSFRSLMALISEEMYLDDYKKFKFELKLISLENKVLSYPTALSASGEYHLLNTAFKKLCRSLDKLYREGVVDEKYLIAGESRLKLTGSFLKKKKNDLAKTKKLPPFSNLRYQPLSEIGFNFPTSSFSLGKKDLQLDADSSLSLEGLKGLKLEALLKKVEHFLPEFEKKCLSGSSDIRTRMSIEKIIEKFSIENLELEDFSRKGLEKGIITLNKLLEVYFKLIVFSKDNYPYPIYFLNLLKILYLQHHFSVALAPACKDVKPVCQYLFYKWLNREAQNPIYYYFHMFDSKKEEELKKLVTWINEEALLPLKFEMENNNNNRAFKITFNESHSKYQKRSWLDFFKEVLPDLIEEEKYAIEGRPSWMQDGELFMSDKLPEWFKCLIQSALYFSYFSDVSISPSKELDRAGTLDVFLEKEYKKDYSNSEYIEIKSSLSGNPKNDSTKFRSLYPPFLNKKMEKMFQEILNSNSAIIESAWVFADKSYRFKKGFSKREIEDYRKLSYANLGGDLGIISLFDFFAKHTDRLIDPDYLILFQMFLFQPGVLIALNEVMKEKLFAFLINQTNKFKKDNELTGYLLCLRLLRRLVHYFPKEINLNFSDLIKENLSQIGLSKENCCLIYAELISTYNEKETLNEDELEELLTGIFFLKVHPISENLIDSYIKKDIGEVLVKFEGEIKRFYQNEARFDEMVLRISKVIHPELEVVWKRIEKDIRLAYQTEDGQGLFLPLEGSIEHHSKSKEIPSKVRNTKLYKKLFRNIHSGEVFADGSCHFVDKKGIQTYVRADDSQKLQVEQIFKEPDHLYAYVPSQTFLGYFRDTSLFISVYLAKQFYHFASTREDREKEIYFKNIKTQEIVYRADLRDVSDKFEVLITRLSDGLVLSKPHDVFEGFEKQEYTHEWVNKNGELKELEFPRYDLKFIKGSDNKFYTETFPGFYLTRETGLKGAPDYKHLLILKNAEGLRKAILPFHHFIKADKPESLNPDYKIEMNNQSCEETYFAFDIDAKRNLKSKSKIANLYLAEVYLLNQSYSKAKKYLDYAAKKLTPFSTEEREILKKIATLNDSTGNEHGEAIGLQTKAAFTLFKNAKFEIQDKKLSDEYLILLHKNYALYLSHITNINSTRLTINEEKEILKHLKDSFPARLEFFKTSKTENEVSWRGTLGAPFPKLDTVSELIISTFNPDRSLFEDYDACYSKLYYEDASRALDKSSGIDFAMAYTLAINLKNDPLNEKFQAALLFQRHREKLMHQEIQKELGLLYFISRSGKQDMFPPLTKEDLENRQTFDLWLEKVLNLAKNLEQEMSLSEREFEATKSLSIISESYSPSFKRAAFQSEEWKKKWNTPLKTWVLKEKEDSIDLKKGECPTIHSLTRLASTLSSIQNYFESKESKEDPDYPLITSELRRLKEDIKEYGIQLTSLETIPFESMDLDSLSIKLRKEVSDPIQLAKFRKQLCKLANKKSEDPLEQSRRNLHLLGNYLKNIQLDDLLFNFAKQRPEELMALNPGLMKEDVHQLYSMIAEYLKISLENQKIIRCLKRIELLKKGVSNEQEINLRKELYLDLSYSTPYDPKSRPAFLVFEYFSELSLRYEQVELLELFLKDFKVNRIMELIMGAGKSSVLLPLLGALRADGEHISILIVTEFLYDSVSSETQRSLRGHTNLRSFKFDGSSDCDVNTLKAILHELKTIKEEKDCLIMTNKSIQCFLLRTVQKAYEFYSVAQDEDSIPEDLALMIKILNEFSSKGLPLLDEADFLLNILREISFASGQKKEMDALEGAVIFQIYHLLLQDEDLKGKMKLDCEKIEQGQKEDKRSVFTPELFESSLKLPLMKAFLESLKTFSYKDKLIEAKVRHFFSNMEEETRQNIEHYLLRTESQIAESQKTYFSLDADIRNILALAGEEISSLLKVTLGRVLDEDYGIGKQECFAIPFSAANTPTEGSQFASPHVTANYTLQTIAKKGISLELLKMYISKLQKEAQDEVKDSFDTKTTIDTEAWKVFKKIRGKLDLPLYNLNDEQISLISEEVNKDLKLCLEIAVEFIFPQMEIYTEKFTSTTLTLTSFFENLIGVTGTLWNKDSMHRKLLTCTREGTDTATILKLFENSYHSISIIPKESLETLADLKVDFDMVADGGGYFKAGKNLDNILVLHKMYGKPVIFFDNDGKIQVFDGINIIPYSEFPDKESCITFLDQARNTGANIPQHEKAIGLVTIGKNMQLRDLLQSCCRLRGLQKGQKVHFLISEDVLSVIRQSLGIIGNIDFSHILAFCILNQARMQSKTIQTAFHKELDEVKQKIVLEVISDENLKISEKKSILMKWRSSWVQNSYRSPDSLYGILPIFIESSEYVKLKVQELKEMLTTDLERRYLGDLEEIARKYQNILPTKTANRESSDLSTLELEHTQESQALNEVEVEVDKAGEDSVKTAGELREDENWTSFVADVFTSDLYPNWYRGFNASASFQQLPTIPVPVFSIETYMNAFEELKPYKKAFDGIDLSINMLSFPDIKELKTEDFLLFGSRRKGIQFLMVDEKTERLRLLNVNEAKQRANHPNFYNLEFGFVNRKDTLSKSLAEKVIKIKFLNGESYFNHEEISFLEKWLKEEGPEKMYHFYTRFALLGHLQKADKFQTSPLKKLFTELIQ